MKNMNRKLFATATVAAIANASNDPIGDILETLTGSVDKITRDALIEKLPSSKEDSPFVGANNLFGRGWDVEWSAFAGDREKDNLGFVTSFNTEFSISWTAPLWATYEHGYQSTY